MDIGFAGAFLGGVAVILSPCSAMLLPSFFAMAFTSRRMLVTRVGLFYLGLLLTMVPLGVAAGALSGLLANRAMLALMGGVVLIGFGLLLIFDISIPLPGRNSPTGTGPLSVIALGAIYGLAGACTGPILGAVLTVAAVSSSAVYGAMLLAVFAAGMVVPLLVLALLWDRFDIAKRLRPKRIKLGPLETTLWGLVAGGVFVVLGVVFILTDATTAIGGLLDARSQLAVETWLGQQSSVIPDVAVIAVIGIVVALLFWGKSRTPQE
ncbi:MAG: cytochrome C biogenesis protein CcdA [Arachnia propionica]|nr:MAG: cytochrome C biogenesis protein CcdA [Arachnia propionica]